ncbi:RDD family protein [Streptomyces roseolus]|uniref:RDD family protein n=1 Tax=Streptomyces roseolus TaxID=67358 RepID=UPI003646EED4
MTRSGVSGPPLAISYPATLAAARRGLVVRWSLLLIGLICAALTVVLINLGGRLESPSRSALVGVGRNLAAVGMTVGLILGLSLLWINHRRRRAINRYPWVAWPINYISTGRYEWVELLDDDRRPVATLILSTWPRDIGKLVNHQTSEVWFAGDPSKYGVVSRPGGADLRYAYHSERRQPPRLAFRQNTPISAQSSTQSATASYELDRSGGRLLMKPTEVAESHHGSKGDARYPSPRLLRRVLAFAFDWVLHIAIGLGVAIAVSHEFSLQSAVHLDWKHVGVSPFLALGCWLAASAVDRVAVQAIFHTTVGKALFGLRVIRPDNGRYPAFGKLLVVWLVDLYLVVAFPIALIANSDAPGPERVEDYFLPAVRKRDVGRDSVPRR